MSYAIRLPFRTASGVTCCCVQASPPGDPMFKRKRQTVFGGRCGTASWSSFHTTYVHLPPGRPLANISPNIPKWVVKINTRNNNVTDVNVGSNTTSSLSAQSSSQAYHLDTHTQWRAHATRCTTKTTDTCTQPLSGNSIRFDGT